MLCVTHTASSNLEIPKSRVVLMAEAVPSSATDEVKIEKRTRLNSLWGLRSKVGTWRVRF